MEAELKKKIRKYADNAYLAVSTKIENTARKALEEVDADLARRNVSNSGFGYRQKLDVEAERIRQFTLAHAEALISGYEINAAPLDEDIIKDITSLYWTALHGVANGMRGEIDFLASRTGTSGQDAANFGNSIKQNLELKTHGLLNEVQCLIEQRRVMPKYKAKETAGNITITGHNARLNYNSTDNSVNSVAVNQTHTFTEIRDTIKAEVPPAAQPELLERLSALEASVSKPTLRERYREFVSLAADYATLMPFIPKLLAIVQQMAG